MRFLGQLFRLVPFSSMFQSISPYASILPCAEFVSGLLLHDQLMNSSGRWAALSD